MQKVILFFFVLFTFFAFSENQVELYFLRYLASWALEPKGTDDTIKFALKRFYNIKGDGIEDFIKSVEDLPYIYGRSPTEKELDLAKKRALLLLQDVKCERLF